jgi:hypothetical protein
MVGGHCGAQLQEGRALRRLRVDRAPQIDTEAPHRVRIIAHPQGDPRGRAPDEVGDEVLMLLRIPAAVLTCVARPPSALGAPRP